MTKHTKGPWNVFKNNDIFGDDYYTVKGDGDIPVCQCAYGDTDNEVNARLISAAPEMLEVLKIFANPPMTSYGARIIEESSYARAREVIKKATGK